MPKFIYKLRATGINYSFTAELMFYKELSLEKNFPKHYNCEIYIFISKQLFFICVDVDEKYLNLKIDKYKLLVYYKINVS